MVRPELWIVAAGVFVTMLLCTMVGLVDWVIFEPMELAHDPGQQIDSIHVEWGLKLLTFAAPIGAASAFLFARDLRRGDY